VVAAAHPQEALHPTDVIAPHGIVEEGLKFLPKPFSERQLDEAVRRALDDR